MKNLITTHLGGLAATLLAVELLGWAGWTIYRYGGETAYLRIMKRGGTRPLALPVNYAITGYVYHGTAVTANGEAQRVTLKTNADDPGPFKPGQLVRVTVNRHYGVTHYQAVAPDQVPLTARNHR